MARPPELGRLSSALADLPFTTGGNLDYSSSVYRKDLADDGR